MNYEDELKIYYLFTLIDGKATVEENQKFAELCKTKKFGNYDKEKIIKECKKLLDDSKNINECSILDRMNRIIGWEEFEIWGNSYIEASDSQRIIWNLISLAYTDNDFSEVERKAINLWAKNFKIPKKVYQDMFDIAQTMLDMTKQKEWLTSTSRPYNEINEKVKKIDKRIQELYESVETLISLSYIES